ncbi:MAG: hypothetical protein MMC23_005811 [Stictis urceolatum]|nr:hypothetical protein [Stictis urceolata]
MVKADRTARLQLALTRGFFTTAPLTKASQKQLSEVSKVKRQEALQERHDYLELAGLPGTLQPSIDFIKYDLEVSQKQRTKNIVTRQDISILLHQLWGGDSHEYDHDRTRVQLALFLCLEEGSGQRGDTFAESSAHRGSNQPLWYKDVSLHLKKTSDGSSEFLLQVGARFRKNHRDLTAKTKDLVSVVLYEQGEHWRNGILYFLALALADRAIRGFSSVEDLLMATPRNGDVWTFQWNKKALEKPVFQMITQNGPTGIALTYGSIRAHIVALGRRAGYAENISISWYQESFLHCNG